MTSSETRLPQSQKVKCSLHRRNWYSGLDHIVRQLSGTWTYCFTYSLSQQAAHIYRFYSVFEKLAEITFEFQLYTADFILVSQLTTCWVSLQTAETQDLVS